MAELKTKATRADVAAFLERIDDATKRDDCRRIAALMAEATGATAILWGDSIVGFGQRRYRYASGREVDWFVIGFAPRKSAISLYLSTGEPLDPALLQQLGRHKMGKGCLTIARLADVDAKVLDQLIRARATAQSGEPDAPSTASEKPAARRTRR